MNNERIKLVGTCDLTGKPYSKELDFSEVQDFKDAGTDIQEKATQISSAFEVLAASPDRSPDFIVYFRGKYVILNRIGPRAVDRITRLLGGLFKGRVFPEVERRSKEKNTENNGKRDSSISLD